MTMSNTSSANLSDLIGALELRSVAGIEDGILEAMGIVRAAGPTGAACYTRAPLCVGFDDDGVLEVAGTDLGPMPTVPPYCRMIDDGALEVAGTDLSATPSVQIRGPGCRFIDDSVLEAAARNIAAGPTAGCTPTIGHPIGIPGCIVVGR